MPENQLRYVSPAREWVQALPIGNGRLGGMVFGTAPKERIQLNEETVWYGGPRDRHNPDAYESLAEIRSLIIGGRLREAEKLADLALTSTPPSQRHYETLGDLSITLDHPSNIENYERNLDLNTATASVFYSCDGTRYTRIVFSSAVHQVIVVRFTADKPRSISFSANLDRSRYMDGVYRLSADSIVMRGKTGGEGGISFRAALKAVAEGGETCVIGENLLVKNADSVTLLLSGNTDFDGCEPEAVCTKQLTLAAAIPFETLLSEHIKEYSDLFSRVSLELGSNIHDIYERPTDERLNEFRQGSDDQGLIALYFQYGRYLLISCSRPGTLPATLQGIWNDSFLPPWDSKYTININTEMNYWLAESCNLPECHLPLLDMIERMRESGRYTARHMYGCRGFVAHHNVDIWADTAPVDRYMPASYWPMGAAWLCLHLWDHYDFCGDKEFLRKVYGTMREAALFFVDFLTEDGKGHLVTNPSVSPENTYRLPNGESGTLCAGPSMDTQIIYTLFSRCIEAAMILAIDYKFVEELSALRERLPKPQIGKHGQIQEWAEDYDEVEPGHRHISHLFGLHPGNLFTLHRTPSLAEAAKRTLERRLSHGGGHTGWSRAWIVNMWARLGEAELAYENVRALLAKSTLPNLFDNHPPFQIDGNFGGTSGIAEMLLQSHDGEISLLPALPGAWRDGKVEGLRARGSYSVSIWWSNGSLSRASVTPCLSGNCRVRTADPVQIESDGMPIETREVEDCVYEFEASACLEYILTPLS